MRPLDRVEESITQRIEGDVAHITGVEVAVLIPMIMDMIITLISACKGNAVQGMKEDSSLRRAAARRIVNKSLKKSKQRVSKSVKKEMVNSLLHEMDKTTEDDLAEVVTEIKTIDWGSL